MKPMFQRLTTEPEEGFAFKEIRSSGFDCPWHVHPEYELILVIQGQGYRIVGDNISRLAAGDLVLVGPGLPHIWQNAPAGQRAELGPLPVGPVRGEVPGRPAVVGFPRWNLSGACCIGPHAGCTSWVKRTARSQPS